MVSAEFIWRNRDSADPFYQQNMRTGICRYCELSANCKKGERMPVISALSRYGIRWHNELKAVPIYPVAGSWENQPVWFIELISQAANIFNKLETEEMSKPAGRK